MDSSQSKGLKNMKKLAFLLVFACFSITQGFAQNTFKIKSIEVERLYVHSDSLADFYNYKIECESKDTTFYMNYKSQLPLLNHKGKIMFLLTGESCLIVEGKKYSFKLEKVCGSELENSYYNYFATFSDSLDCSVFEHKSIKTDEYRYEFIPKHHSIVEVGNKIYRVVDLGKCFNVRKNHYR